MPSLLLFDALALVLVPVPPLLLLVLLVLLLLLLFVEKVWCGVNVVLGCDMSDECVLWPMK